MKKAFLPILLGLIITLAPLAHAEETDWYTEKADELTSELHDLISFEGYAEYFTGSEEVLALVDSWKLATEKEPTGINGYDMPDAKLLMSMAGGIEISMPDVLLKRMERGIGSSLISTVNGQYGGSVLLAAASMCTLTEGYVMPEGFKPCIVIYEYEGICLCVSFAQIGEGVVMATAQFAVAEIAELLKTDLGGIVE